MRFKKILFFLFAAVSCNSVFSQFYISQGATVHMSGNALLYSGQQVINKGSLNGGTGTVICNSHLNDSSVFNASSALLVFTGSGSQNAVFGNSSLKKVSISKTSGDVNFLNNVPVISDTLLFSSGKAIINNNSITTKATTGGSSSAYVKTTGTGLLVQPLANNATKVFPVGNASYNPVSITNKTGIADSIGFRVIDEVYQSGLTGAVINRGRVKRTWLMSRKNNNAGSGYNITLTWADSSAVSLTQPRLYAFDGNNWVQQNGTYNVSGSSITYTGYTGNATIFSVQQNCQASTTNIITTICPSQVPYLWNGNSYTASGTYSWTGTNALGCDSIVTLNLTISNNSINIFAQDTISTCGASYILNAGIGYTSYAWSTGATTASISVTTSKWYTCTVSQTGCISTDSVYVQITNPTAIPVPASITIQSIQTNICGSRKYRYVAPVLPVNARGYQWSFVGSLFSGSGTIDSGSLTSRIITVTYTSNNACSSTDSVKLRYQTVCGVGNWKALKLTNTVLNAPAAPTAITVQAITTNNCGARRYRYIAPILPSATASTAAATGWQWELIGSMSEYATIDSGNENSRIIVVSYSSNDAAQTGDSIKLSYQSDCGYSKAKALKMTNTKLSAPVIPVCITIQPVATNICGSRKYRYVGHDLPIATASTGAATGWQWSMPTGTVGSSAVLDSGSLTSKIIVLRFTSNAAAGTGDSIKIRYNSDCGYSPYKATKLTNTAINPPLAPTAITITPLQINVCGDRKYRYIAPVLPAATTTSGAATGWQWSMPIGTVGATAVLDSGSLTSRIIVLKFSSNAAAGVGDTIKLKYNSDCGFGPIKAMKLSNTLLSVPLAPASITATLVQNDCGARVYRYTAPLLPVATASTAAPTGYAWTMPIGPLGSLGTLDSGSLSSRTIKIFYSSNDAAQTGDSIQLKYQSSCGSSLNKSMRLTNAVKTGCLPTTRVATPYAKNNERKAAPKKLTALLFPNPSTEHFSLKLNSPSSSAVRVTIYDLQGKQIKQIQLKSNSISDFGNDLKPGVYHLQIQQDGELQVIRAVKL